MVFHSAKAGDNTVVVNYNDHNGSGYSGISYSTDGGTTFTEILPSPLNSGHGTNYGDPIVVFNLKLNQWFAGDLATGCGGQGVGLWTSPDGINWTPGACAHNNSADDRESMWVDNNPFSAVYGRMYISFNNFNVGGGALSAYPLRRRRDLERSRRRSIAASFATCRSRARCPARRRRRRDTTARCSLPRMDEGGGGLATRQNVMYRSMDGGVTWTSSIMGPRFNPVGDGICPSNSYFAKINPIWRHMGWGEPGVGPGGVVHYAYAGQRRRFRLGTSTTCAPPITAQTWSAPIVLEPIRRPISIKTTGCRPSPSTTTRSALRRRGKVTVSWYDRRQATSACNVATDPGCSYQRYGVQSPDNGVTWGSNVAISDVRLSRSRPRTTAAFSPATRATTTTTRRLGSTAYVTWTDGRVAVGGVQVQNVEFVAVPEP